MKWYYVTDGIFSPTSVEGIHGHEVCRTLVELGHDVTVYAYAGNDAYANTSYVARLIAGGRVFQSPLFQLRLYLQLRRDVVAHRPDVIYVRHNHLLLVPTLIARQYHIPLVLECNGILLEESRMIEHSMTGRALLALGVFRIVESYVVRNARRIVAVAPGIKEYLVRTYGIRNEVVQVIANGVDTEMFRPRDRSERTKISLDPSALYIGYIGSLYPWQGLRYIVEAMRLVHAQRPLVRFFIVGDGEDAEYIRSFVTEHDLGRIIEVRPAVPYNEAPLYRSAPDICLCYPTRFRAYITSPLKVYEYLACGRAVICSDIGGMREEFGDTVVYAEPESAEALATTIVTLIDDKNMREQLGAKGREFVEKGRSWRVVAERIATLCQSIVKG